MVVTEAGVLPGELKRFQDFLLCGRLDVTTKFFKVTNSKYAFYVFINFVNEATFSCCQFYLKSKSNWI